MGNTLQELTSNVILYGVNIMYVIWPTNYIIQPLTLATISPLLPMSDARLSWRPRLWQSSHVSLLSSVPIYSYWSTTSLWLLDGGQECTGAAVTCLSMGYAACHWIPRAQRIVPDPVSPAE